ncbi:GntR family transcriptional regulator [Bradyrhizobium sp. CCGUVB1N3]|uniref:GntR family transcriptional regulator n=1 Tax=Bradyrhizobium sp. CCGUVB1N3 TaxID=2949629 RepID=UPI0020B3C99D|nr:GntR family transcriptional regulator [Bradyrhizobium sp. CCGUVB1N3]MCP3476770.1 GntR family transcriptional regulator [Bradyrhizobium sp. CCGUVB1N3]
MRVRTSDALRKELEDDIEHGRLLPGDRLDEQTLAERFEVSRTPAREALLQLAAAGIVQLVPRHGAVVSGVSPQLAIGMVEVLTALEAEAAGLAARRMSAAEKVQLVKLHLASQAAVKRLDNPTYIENNAAFHEAIYQGARNEFLAEQVRLTRQRMRFYHRSSLNQPARLKASWQEHARITDAIKSGDEALAQQAMREHILFGGRVFADMIASLSKTESRKP